MRLAFVPILLLLGGAIGFGVATSMQSEQPALAPTPGTLVQEDAPAPDPQPAIVESLEVAEEPRNTADHTAISEQLPAVVSETIHGQVLDEAGEPIVGVRLVATPQEKPADFTYLKPQDVSEAEYLECYRTLYQWQSALLSTAGTNESGQYVLSGLRDTTYNIAAAADDYQLEMTPRAWNIAPGTQVNFTGYSQGSIELRIVLPDGTSPKKAQIEVTQRTAGHTRTNHHQWTARKPKIDLRFGAYEVRAVVNDDHSSDTAHVLVSSDEPHHEHRFEMVGRSGIRGTIVLPVDEAVTENQHLLIRHMKWAAEREIDLDRLKQADSIWVSGGQRTFTIPDLAEGEYLIGLARDWNSDIAVHQRVQVRKQEMTEIRLEVPAQDMSSVLIAHVEDHDGKPVTSCQFSLEIRTRDGGSSSTGGAPASRKTGGAYWINLNDDQSSALAGEDNKQLRLHVRYGVYGTRIVEVPDREPIHVQFGPPAMASIHITNYSGHELEGDIQITTTPADVGSNRNHVRYFGHSTPNKIDADGYYAIGPVEAGSYEIAMSFMRGRRGGQSIESRVVQLNEGDNEVPLLIPPLYGFRVRVEETTSGRATLTPAKTSADSQNWRQGIRSNFKDGVAEFEYVAPGSYKLQVRVGSTRGTMNIDVPGAEEIIFEKEPDPVYDGLAVTIDDSEGSLAKAGFRAGDVIVGFADTTIESYNHISLFWALARTKDELTVTVQRESGELEMTVPGSTFTNYQKMGGKLNNSQRE